MLFKLFPALFDRPVKIRFVEQEHDEKIELFLREHPITNLGWITTALLLIVLPPLIFAFEESFGFSFFSRLSNQLLIGGLIIYYQLVLAFVIERFLSWYFNVYIVTNEHLIDINFNSLLSREIVEIGLDDIEVITTQTGGILDSLFNFGDITVETASELQNLRFENVPRPDFVVDRIQDLRTQRKLFFEGGNN